MSNAYEWAAVRAVPRVERGEYVNVGVILYCQALDFLQAEVTEDLSRVTALCQDVDLPLLRDHLEAVRALCAGEPAAGDGSRRPVGERFRWLVAPRSTMVQTSPVHTGLTDDPAAELAELYQRMVVAP